MSFLLVILICGAFVLLLVKAVKAAKAQQERHEQALRELGFYPVAQTDRELESRLEHANRWRKGEFTVRRAYFRHQANGKFYLVDLRAGKNSDNDDRSVCAILPGFTLPRFFLYPSVPGDNAFSRLAQRALNWAIQRTGAREVSRDLVECPGYCLYADDASAVRSAFDRDFWTYFSRLPGHVLVQAENDFVQVSLMMGGKARIKMNGQDNQREELRSQFDTAEQVCRLMQQYSSRTTAGVRS